MMDRPGFGTVIIPNRHLMTGDTTAAFKHQQLFHGGVAMRRIAGASRKTKQRGSSAGNWIEREQLRCHPWSDAPPSPFRRPDEGEPLCRLLKSDLGLPISDPLGGCRSNHQYPQEA